MVGDQEMILMEEIKETKEIDPIEDFQKIKEEEINSLSFKLIHKWR